MNRLDQLTEIARNSDKDPTVQKLFLRDLVAGKILDALAERDMNKADLALKMRCSKAHVSRVLSGDRNVTLDTLSEIAIALNYEVRFELVDKTKWSFSLKGIPRCESFNVETPDIGNPGNEYRPYHVYDGKNKYSGIDCCGETGTWCGVA